MKCRGVFSGGSKLSSAREYLYHRTLYRNRVSLRTCPTMRSTSNSVAVSIESGSSVWFEVERGLSGVDDAEIGTKAGVSRWKNTVLCVPSLSVDLICFLTLIIEEDRVVFDTSLLYVAVVILSAFFSKESTSDRIVI